MSVNLSIKHVPDDVAESLRQRAERNHRSLQRELLALVEQAARDGGVALVREPEVRYAVQVQLQAPADELLAELDAIVAGSHWGAAPLLAREQLHDRALARELDFDARTAQRKSDSA